MSKKKQIFLIEILGALTLLFGCFLKSSFGPRFLPEAMQGVLNYSNIFFWAGLFLVVYLWIWRDKPL